MGRDREFSDFVDERRPALLQTAFMLTGDRAAAEDLVQNALLRAYLSWDKVTAADSPYAYTRRILLHGFSRQRRRRRFVEQASNAAESAWPLTEQTEDRDQLRRALQALGPRQRAVLVLRYVEDLSVEQVADLLGVSPGTVKSQAARALAQLRVSVHFDPSESR